MKTWQKSLYLLFILTLFGCPKKIQPPKVEDIAPPQVQQPTEVSEPTIRGEEFQSIPELKSVYFEYDKFNLTDEAKKVLQKNAEYLLSHPEYEILVEGHCCECGSNEYNLGLGQKRASVVREFYMSLGISGGKIATISYGEEKPVNKAAGPPDSPLCQPNRRAETKVRVKK
ncbi:MAG: OmpA family protein [Endomicrobia bacterium]|nr:OmpA family protein [Endomicrobiia bacterium]MCX7716277.1 OmpA family protein [Endomicrobiia bacterium]